jgi:hypothetical protein
LKDHFFEIHRRRRIAGQQIPDRFNEMIGLLCSGSERPEKVVSTARQAAT